MSFLTDFRLSNSEQNLGVYGIMVHQGDRLTASHRFRSNDRVNLYSASKTVAALGLGMAIDEGRLSLDDRVLDFFPQYKEAAAEGAEAITVRHLLQMSSGHMNEDPSLFNQRDRAQLFFEMPMKARPGAEGSFYYENNCTYMLGRIVEALSGDTMLAYLKPRLFEPLEIANPQWFTCALGHTVCSTGLMFTTEELSKISRLLLAEGVYKDRQLVSKAFIEAQHRDCVATPQGFDPEADQGYGYQVWRSTLANSYRADGMYGQYALILKDQNAAITVTAHNEQAPKEILRAIWKDVVPKL